MALRDKLADRVRPYLEPGEQIQALFPARSGPSPYWSLLSAWIVLIAGGYWTIVATDRAFLLIRNSRFSGRPKKLELRGRRDVLIGPASGLWGKVQLDQRYWVHKRFHKDIVAADQALHAMSLPPQQFPPYQQ